MRPASAPPGGGADDTERLQVPSRKRTEKQEAVREAVIRAAARVVGTRGYAKASIARIADEAGVAYGSIYQYFRNQREVFENLLPSVGRAMLRHIRDTASAGGTVMERERDGLDANFDYLHRNPELHRVRNEAVFFVPEVHKDWLERMSAGYQRSLRRGLRNGELERYGPEEIEALSYLLMGAREYMLERYCARDGRVDRIPPEVRATYLKFAAMAMGVPEVDARPGPDAPPDDAAAEG